MDNKTNILKDFCALVQFDKVQAVYVADATGICQERILELAQGSEPTAAELLAVCCVAAYHDADESCRPGSARDIAKRWLDCCYTRTFRELNYLNDLLEFTGLTQIDELLEKFHIFMDGSSLCSEGMSHLLEKLLPDLKKLEHTRKISVPVTVVNRLQSMASDEVVAKLADADVGMRNLITIQDEDLMVVRGDENDTSILGTFISAFSKFKPTHSLLLLTNDESMANAIEKLNAIGIEGDDILVAKLRKDGRPILWFAEEDEEELILPAEGEATATPVLSEESAAEEIDDMGWVLLSDDVNKQIDNGDNENVLVSDDAENIQISEEEIPGASVDDDTFAVEDTADMLEALFGTPELTQDDELTDGDSEFIRIEELPSSDQNADVPDDPTQLADDILLPKNMGDSDPDVDDITSEDATLLADVMQMVFDNPQSDNEEENVLDDEGLEQLMNISFLLNSDIDDEDPDLSGDEDDLPDSQEDLPEDLDELIMQFTPEWSLTSPEDEGEATYKYDVT